VATAARLKLDHERLADFCVRNRICWLALFGSVLRDDFDDESDVDFLFELEPGTRAGLFTIVGMQQELAEIVGRQVDLVFPDELSKYIRQRVLAEAEDVFVH
jgi:predicted nucleotidyltransferase